MFIFPREDSIIIFGNFPGKMNRKLDMVIHILQSKNRNETNNSTRQENVEFLQLQTKEEFDAFEKLLLEDARKQEQFVSINYISHVLNLSKADFVKNLCYKFCQQNGFCRHSLVGNLTKVIVEKSNI